MASTPRTPAPERAPPPVPIPPPPVEMPPPPSPSSSQPGDEYHTPAPSLADGSPREEASSFPRDGREGAPAPPKSPQLSPMRLAAPRLLPPPSPSPRAGQNGQEEEEGGAKAAAAAGTGTGTAAPAREPLRLATKDLARSPSSQRSLATTNSSPSPSPSPTPPSPLTPAVAPVVNSSCGNNNRSCQSTPKRAAETKLPLPLPLSSPAAATAAIAAQHFDPVEEAVTSPLHLGGQTQQQQQQQEQHAAVAAENGGSVPPDVAAAVAVGERRELSVTLRLATAVLSLAAFSVIASARTSGWAGDYYAHHLQYRYAVAVNVIVCAYSIAQSFGEIRRLISPRSILLPSRSSYYCSLFLDQALAYLLMSASSAAASRNDLWVSRFGTDAFNRKITSALWLSFIAFLMLALNALISTANLFSML